MSILVSLISICLLKAEDHAGFDSPPPPLSPSLSLSFTSVCLLTVDDYVGIDPGFFHFNVSVIS